MRLGLILVVVVTEGNGTEVDRHADPINRCTLATATEAREDVLLPLVDEIGWEVIREIRRRPLCSPFSVAGQKEE